MTEQELHQLKIKAALYDRECELLTVILTQATQIENLRNQLMKANGHSVTATTTDSDARKN